LALEQQVIFSFRDTGLQRLCRLFSLHHISLNLFCFFFSVIAIWHNTAQCKTSIENFFRTTWQW